MRPSAALIRKGAGRVSLGIIRGFMGVVGGNVAGFMFSMSGMPMRPRVGRRGGGEGLGALEVGDGWEVRWDARAKSPTRLLMRSLRSSSGRGLRAVGLAALVDCGVVVVEVEGSEDDCSCCCEVDSDSTGSSFNAVACWRLNQVL